MPTTTDPNTKVCRFCGDEYEGAGYGDVLDGGVHCSRQCYHTPAALPTLPRFRIEGDDGITVLSAGTMAEAAQDAECLHAETGVRQTVIAIADDEHGLFDAGDPVYFSEGPDDCNDDESFASAVGLT